MGVISVSCDIGNDDYESLRFFVTVPLALAEVLKPEKGFIPADAH